MRRLLPTPLLIALSACGGGSSTPTTPAPNNPYTFTITAGGVSPKQLTVPQGSRVLFVNNDSRRRNMTSDPHPEHDACPEINTVGLLNAGANRETANMVVIRTCGFHDHDDPNNTGVQGQIIVRP
jgi:hypothetical protein